MQYDYDLVVIGAGSGGVRAARLSAGKGKRVAIIERQSLGGTCVNVGCIPKKLFHYAALFSHDFSGASNFGWQMDHPVFNWEMLANNVATEVARLNGVYRNLLVNAGVDLVVGEGRITGPHTVVVDGKVFSSERILITVGGAPFRPAIPGAEFSITSDDFFSLAKKPSSAVVIGGGYIAVELASVLNGLGVQTTLLHRGDRLLKNFDSDLGSFLQAEMHKKGVMLALGENVNAIEKSSEGFLLRCDSGRAFMTDCVLYATGRNPVTSGLGLESIAAVLKPSGHIAVNDQYQTAQPSVYAIGDVVGFRELTPVATAEAMWLVDHWFGEGAKKAIDYTLVPSCVFSSPEVASVGLTQAQAESSFGDADVIIYRTDFRPLKHTVSGSNERMLMKLVVQRSTDRVLGLHMVGAEAGEIVQGFAVAVQMGATKQQFDATIGIHPTAAEEFVTLRTPLPR